MTALAGYLLRRRPHHTCPLTSSPVDDVIRATSIRAIGAAGVGLLLLILAFELHTIGGTTDIQVLRWTLPCLGLACFAGALGVWMRLGS